MDEKAIAKGGGALVTLRKGGKFRGGQRNDQKSGKVYGWGNVGAGWL